MKRDPIFILVVLLGIGAALLWWFTRPVADASAATKVTETPAVLKFALAQSVSKPAQVEAPKVAPAKAADAPAVVPADSGLRRGPAAIGLTPQEKAEFDRARQNLLASIDNYRNDPHYEQIKKFKEQEIAELDNLSGPIDLGSVRIATGVPIDFTQPWDEKITVTFTKTATKPDRGQYKLHVEAERSNPDGSTISQSAETIITPGTTYGFILDDELFRITPQ